MDIEQTWAEIQTLPSLIYSINKRETSAIALLDKLNRRVFGAGVVAGCSNCHIKAFRKLTSLTYQILEIMSEQKFKLKKGTLLEYPMRGGRFFNPQTISDDVAIKYLTDFPKGVKHFASYPKDDNGELLLPVTDEPDTDNEGDGDDTHVVIGTAHDPSVATGDETILPVEYTERSLKDLNKADLQTKHREIIGTDAPADFGRKELISALLNNKK